MSSGFSRGLLFRDDRRGDRGDCELASEVGEVDSVVVGFRGAGYESDGGRWVVGGGAVCIGT